MCDVDPEYSVNDDYHHPAFGEQDADWSLLCAQLLSEQCEWRLQVRLKDSSFSFGFHSSDGIALGYHCCSILNNRELRVLGILQGPLLRLAGLNAAVEGALFHLY